MSAPPRSKWLQRDYDRAAEEYLATLPLEHFMEATVQSIQRRITDASFTILGLRLLLFHFFGELLVQYFFEGNLRRVVPDNMVVLGELSEHPRTNYSTELEPRPIFWALEYVSPNNRRKDYVENMRKYESELKIPYYLLFEPERYSLLLYKLNGAYYHAQQSGKSGRYLIPELELEVGLLDSWVRYWHRGELLPLPAELQQQVDQQREKIRALENQLTSIVAVLRPLVEARARVAGRQDILEQLPDTTDGQVLTRWLAELA
jgi:Uma2 family endonuclease